MDASSMGWGVLCDAVKGRRIVLEEWRLHFKKWIWYPVILLHAVNTKYVFPPLKFLHQVVCKFREKKESVLFCWAIPELWNLHVWPFSGAHQHQMHFCNARWVLLLRQEPLLWGASMPINGESSGSCVKQTLWMVRYQLFCLFYKST